MPSPLPEISEALIYAEGAWFASEKNIARKTSKQQFKTMADTIELVQNLP